MYGRSQRRIRLGALLRGLRKNAKLSGEALADQLAVSQSHLSRVELGDTAPSRELVERWTRMCGAPEDSMQQALELAEAVVVEVTARRTVKGRSLVALQRDAEQAVAAATVISGWVPLLVPGLLQTAGYAQHLVAGDFPDREDIAEAVAARMQRQTVLYDQSKTLRWVISEAGLRWRVAPPDVMAAQLDRLSMLALEPHLDLRVLPFANTGPVWHDHGFNILGGRTDGHGDLVSVGLLTGPARITEPAEVAEYKKAYERLAELALSGADAVAFIRQVMAETRQN